MEDGEVHDGCRKNDRLGFLVSAIQAEELMTGFNHFIGVGTRWFVMYNHRMGKMSPMVRYWLKSSEEDFRAAWTLSQNKHYRLTIFCCHLSIEKGIKAILQYQTGFLPPQSHDLGVLLSRTGLAPPGKLTSFIDQLAVLSVPTRYPGPLSAASLGFGKRWVEGALRKTEKVIQWCRQNCP